MLDIVVGNGDTTVNYRRETSPCPMGKWEQSSGGKETRYTVNYLIRYAVNYLNIMVTSATESICIRVLSHFSLN